MLIFLKEDIAVIEIVLEYTKIPAYNPGNILYFRKDLFQLSED